MIGRTIEIVLGAALVVLALRDVFDTVVVPGESRARCGSRGGCSSVTA